MPRQYGRVIVIRFGHRTPKDILRALTLAAVFLPAGLSQCAERAGRPRHDLYLPAMGRVGSEHHSDHEPGYSAASMPTVASAATTTDAVTPEPQSDARTRVNRVNLRREYFYATPAEVKTALIEIAEIAGNLLEFTETAEAEQYHASELMRAAEPASDTQLASAGSNWPSSPA